MTNVFSDSWTDRHIWLRAESRCAIECAATDIICQKSTQDNQRELWHAGLLSSLSRSARLREVPCWRTFSLGDEDLSSHTDKTTQMNCLVSSGIVEQYRPLADTKGSYSAQFEHVGSIFTSLPNEYTALTHITTSRLFYSTRHTKRSLVAEMTIDLAWSDAVEVNQSWSNHTNSKLDSPHRLKVWR